jgi:hypothetical protein
MEEYIHRENMALFRRRLSETHEESQRQVLLKLLAEEGAKNFLRKGVEAETIGTNTLAGETTTISNGLAP